MAIMRFILVFFGVLLCAIGAVQVRVGIPDLYVSRNVAELQSDANEILLGIAFILGGVASGIFALSFYSLSHQEADKDAEG